MEHQLPSFHKTRLAPTPSGYLHLGNVLSFVITASIAAKTGARILLRIDDMDRERQHPKYVQDIFDTLNFIGIEWQEGPRNMEEYESVWSQVHRMDLYEAALKQLQETGEVFACTCTRSDILKISPDGSYPGTCRHKGIPLDTANACWRLRTAGSLPIPVKDLSGTVITSALPTDMSDFIVRRKDGFIAYQLTSLVDDTHFGIDLVVRGEDLWHSTLAQQYLAIRLGMQAFQQATFYHHTMVPDADGKKLSKSEGATSIQYMRGQGMSAEDIYAMIEDKVGTDRQFLNLH